MKTYLIYKRQESILTEKLGSYQALSKDDTSANRSHLHAEPMACHIELPEGLDEDCVKPQFTETSPEQIITLREPIEAVEGQEEIIDEETGEVLQEYIQAVEAQEGLYHTLPAIVEWVLVEDLDKKAIKEAYLADGQKRAIKAIIEDAKIFGNNLMNDFTVENMMLGITQDGMTSHVRKTMAEVILALTTGSLYDAIAEAKIIPNDKKDSKYISDARLLSFINRIETYLNKPLSQSL